MTMGGGMMSVPVRRERDAEAELNLPPGFRFHPTDDELVEHYLCRKAAGQRLPVPIIAEVDLYKFDPWDLPDRALFGTREWYFFTPRDRKYPNGSRPNRAAGNGYWKATGADKPVAPKGRTLGIKKALVFYAGKAPRGVKTDWIMHEYRLADAGRAAAAKKGSLRLDDWVLCRLYNKKNEWEKMQMKKGTGAATATAKEEEAGGDMTTSWNSHSHSWGETRTPESEIVDNDPFPELDSFPAFQDPAPQQHQQQMMVPKKEKVDDAAAAGKNDLFIDLSYDDIQSMYSGLDMLPPPGEDFYSSLFASPRVKGNQTAGVGGLAPF
ncbi:hypothetical protein PR202_gb10499 [Eleusine coracana subsp. coracana]|uniref:NAC domain-containing protein n=1 Tax=Eleusine coracana subsp. coracana TaxID=191504 RepID=A0AAV5EK15_ELECO|nr:hypothetical protein PR202_gb10499 [Eleusine coracana subsp. coracana]